MPRLVQHTPELARILALPRRDWEDYEKQGAAEKLTGFLRTPAGRMALFPHQAAVLVELADYGGVLAQLGVGKGKTLISALAPVVVKAKRPLLIVPANLRDKTRRDFAALREHWQMGEYRLVSYEELGRAGGMLLLETYRPDLLILDECHKAKNPAAGVTRKLLRYIREHRDELRVLDMSGTLGKRSIQDFAHLALWAQPTRCPFPVEHTAHPRVAKGELTLWCGAVDEKVQAKNRVEVGALSLFGGEGEDEIDAARRGIQDRIFSTPGFIATKSNDVEGCNLVIECHEVGVSEEVNQAYAALKSWMTPCGLDIENGIELWRHCRELATDFYYRWKVKPPADWMQARRDWCKAVRETLAHNRRQLDTEDQVRREVVREGESHALWPIWRRWKEIEPTFELETVPVWTGKHCLDFVRTWAKKHTGVIWVEWPIVGMRLAKELGIEYYGRGGLNAVGRPIEDEKGDRCAVASIKANGTGRNLQTIWSRALVTSAPPTGTDAEQMIGRLHRHGQPEDEVVIDVMIACREQLNGFIQSMRDANFHNAVLGSQMKMMAGSKACDIIIPDLRKIGSAWAEPLRN